MNPKLDKKFLKLKIMITLPVLGHKVADVASPKLTLLSKFQM